MASHIAFLNSKTDVSMAKSFYADSAAFRVSLHLAGGFRLGELTPLWIDPGLDGYHILLKGHKVQDKWKNMLKSFPHSDILANDGNLKSPDKTKLQQLVDAALDKCLEHSPKWISVPQLPVVSDSSRNAVNREMALATGNWRQSRGFKGVFVLPVLVTHREQVRIKGHWDKILKLAKQSVDRSGAQAVWTVDTSLGDQEGAGPNGDRFKAILAFQEGIRSEFPNVKLIVGPYWGLNLVLWARQSADHPAINLGTTYRHYISGGHLAPSSKSHLAIAPLRRWAVISPELRTWFEKSVAKLSPSDPARKELESLSGNIGQYMSLRSLPARKQTATFYKKWFDEIEAIPQSGRALSLFQQFSSAFVLGKQLPSLPRAEGTGRKPSVVAEQFMLACL